MADIKLFSFGGGVQSMAAMVLAAMDRIDYSTFAFCNVGEDSENPGTLEYINRYARPFAEDYGLEFVELERYRRNGERDTVYTRVLNSKRSQVIPVRLSDNGYPGNRNCTVDFKIKLTAKFLRERGATAKHPAVVGLGISTDEFQRARTDSGIPHELLEYPLIDLRLSRDDCKRIITEVGLPVPPKSACWFCPMRRASGWAELRRDKPVTFLRVVAMEKMLSERTMGLKGEPIFFHSRLKPLAVATDILPPLARIDDDSEDGGCESGYCWT